MGLNTRAGKLKTMGAIVCLAGALTASLYRGQAFHLNHHSLHPHLVVKPSKAHWARGTFLLVASCFSYGAWFIVQVHINIIIFTFDRFALETSSDLRFNLHYSRDYMLYILKSTGEVTQSFSIQILGNTAHMCYGNSPINSDRIVL